MASRRKSRFDTLLPSAATEDAVTKLRRAMRKASGSLVPFNERCRAPHQLDDDLRIALNVLAGRPVGHMEPWIKPAFMSRLGEGE